MLDAKAPPASVLGIVVRRSGSAGSARVDHDWIVTTHLKVLCTLLQRLDVLVHAFQHVAHPVALKFEGSYLRGERLADVSLPDLFVGQNIPYYLVRTMLE